MLFANSHKHILLNEIVLRQSEGLVLLYYLEKYINFRSKYFL